MCWGGRPKFKLCHIAPPTWEHLSVSSLTYNWLKGDRIKLLLPGRPHLRWPKFAVAQNVLAQICQKLINVIYSLNYIALPLLTSTWSTYLPCLQLSFLYLHCHQFFSLHLFPLSSLKARLTSASPRCTTLGTSFFLWNSLVKLVASEFLMFSILAITKWSESVSDRESESERKNVIEHFLNTFEHYWTQPISQVAQVPRWPKFPVAQVPSGPSSRWPKFPRSILC